AGSGPVLAVFDNRECVGVAGGSCDCPGSTFAVCPNSDPQSPGCPSPWKDNLSPLFRNGDLGRFRADAMFGGETGDGDVWGASPRVADASRPSAPNLHLAADDDVALNAGTAIDAATFGVATDVDGETRPQAGVWDVGADEATFAAATPVPCAASKALSGKLAARRTQGRAYLTGRWS